MVLPLAHIFDLENELALFFLADSSRIQDAFRFRALRRSLALAHFLMSEKGEVDKEKIHFLIRELEAHGVPLYPGGYNDWEIRNHFLKTLYLLKEPPFLRLIQKFGLPLCHSKAEALVRESIGLENKEILKESHVRIAALSALFCPLRQNVGSCFATAPAILVQEEQSGRFLEDLLELLTTGKLKRIIGGKEFVVPMSPSSGSGDLKKNIFAFSSKERILFSPGLIIAFEKIGLIDKAASLERKREELASLASPILEGKEKMSVEELIRKIILDQFQIEQMEFANYEKSKRGLFKSGQIITQIAGKKAESIEMAMQMMGSALAYFKSFADHLLLKTWEFTMASFVDVKLEFSQWNLYTSLGLHSEESGGIGEVVRTFIQKKIDEKNEKMQTFQAEYEIAFEQVRGVERLLKNAGSEQEARRLRAEYQSRYYHMQVCLELRDENHKDGEEYVSFFPFLLENYREKLQDYFQEIYDAELQGIVLDSLYDDSPAGFRLLYKHGRSDPSVWSFIHNKEEYIQALINFFLATEQTILSLCQWKEGKGAIPELTTAIVQHLATENFLKSAFLRMARAHKTALRDLPLEKLEKTPWAYTSGGTMDTLLRTYFKRENQLSCESKWVESPMDLLIFIIDVLKMAPEVPSGERMLITSPTHAFSLLTHATLLRKAYEARQFTYTWVRDHLLLPGIAFYEKIVLGSIEQRFLIDKFQEMLPLKLHQALSPFNGEMSVKEFRTYLLNQIEGNLLYFATEWDRLLYQMLPLVSSEQAEELFLDLGIKKMAQKGLMGAWELRELAFKMVLESQGTLFDPDDCYLTIMKKARHLGLAPKEMLIFADSNWSERESYFAFLVSPATSKIELWLVDRTGNLGRPMHIWEEMWQGDKQRLWTLYFNAHEYFFPVHLK